MIIAGIDPGLKGSIAIHDTETKDYLFFRMPVDDGNIAGYAIYNLLKKHKVNIVILEKVHSMPKQGVVSTFTFGKGYGVLIGAIQAHSEEFGCQLEEISATEWKRYHGLLRSEKDKVLDYGNYDKSKVYAISKMESKLLIKYYLKESI